MAEENINQPPVQGEEKKSRKGLWIGLGVCAGVLAAGAIAGGVYVSGQRNTGTFLKGTKISGVSVAGATPQQTAELLTERYEKKSEVSLVEKKTTVLAGTLPDYGYTLDQEGLQKNLEALLKKQKSSAWTILSSLWGGQSPTADLPYSFDETTFDKKVCAAALSVQRTASQDAKIVYDKDTKTLSIQEEVYGNTFQDADLQAAVKKELDPVAASNTDSYTVKIDIPADIYEKPAVTKDDKDLTAALETMKQYEKSEVVYTFGDEKQTLDFSEASGWFTAKDGEVRLDEEKVKAYVKALADKYDTRYKARKFKTTGGNEITFPAGKNEYGYTIDQEAEAEQLEKDLTGGKTVTREPVYVKKNSYGNPYYLARNGVDDLDGTYVEVSISGQHMWFYKEGKLVVDSAVVTGNVSKGHSTQTGVFPLAYKESPSVLTGGNGENGYETPVNYWMPFYEGQGLHDANWRSSFGGSIYLTNGSHGCVNLPPSVAATVYNNISSGTAILIYN